MVNMLNRGYYMTARRYEISLRVLKNISRVSAANEWNIFSTREYMRKSCYTVNSPWPNNSLRRITLVWCCLPPPPLPRHCPVIGCNYALCKTETSLRRITNTFETVNGPLISALGNENYLGGERKCRCTTWQVTAIRVSKLHTRIQYASSYSSKRHIKRNS